MTSSLFFLPWVCACAGGSLLLTAGAEFAEVGSHAGVGGTTERGQTFVVEHDGTLAMVEIWLKKGDETVQASLVADIRPTDELGVPVEDDGEALEVVTTPATAVLPEESWLALGFSVPVTAGQGLALCVRSSDVEGWNYGLLGGDDAYAEGGGAERDPENHPWSVGSSDYGFRVWVEPPVAGAP